MPNRTQVGLPPLIKRSLFTGRPEREWEAIGNSDPYFGVIADERFRGRALTGTVRKQFFASGEQHLAQILAAIDQHVRSDFKPRTALEFGCGVGRVLVPLALRCEHVVGIDVASSMLREARANLDAAGLEAKVTWGAPEQLADLVSEFDLVHSFIVFQHIPVSQGEALLRQLLSAIAPNGVGVFQFTTGNADSRVARFKNTVRVRFPRVRRLYRYLADRSAPEPVVQMNTYNERRIRRLIEASGCQIKHRVPTRHAAHSGMVFFVTPCEYSRRARHRGKIEAGFVVLKSSEAEA